MPAVRISTLRFPRSHGRIAEAAASFFLGCDRGRSCTLALAVVGDVRRTRGVRTCARRALRMAEPWTGRSRRGCPAASVRNVFGRGASAREAQSTPAGSWEAPGCGDVAEVDGAVADRRLDYWRRGLLDGLRRGSSASDSEVSGDGVACREDRRGT